MYCSSAFYTSRNNPWQIWMQICKNKFEHSVCPYFSPESCLKSETVIIFTCTGNVTFLEIHASFASGGCGIINLRHSIDIPEGSKGMLFDEFMYIFLARSSKRPFVKNGYAHWQRKGLGMSLSQKSTYHVRKPDGNIRIFLSVTYLCLAHSSNLRSPKTDTARRSFDR